MNNKKHITRLIIIITIILLVQLVFVCFAFYMIKMTFNEEEKSDYETVTVVVLDTDNPSFPRTSSFAIYTQNKEYHFLTAAIHDEYKSGKLEDSVFIGDEIELTYYTKVINAKEINWVVEARSGNKTYASIEQLNSDNTSQGVMAIILFSIFELMLLVFSGYYIFSCVKSIRTQSKEDDYSNQYNWFE